MTTPLIELSAIVKDYRGLRPLRIERLVVGAGEQVALSGLDEVSAEVFINVMTGATLPDSGSVNLFGRETASISDSSEWLAVVDRCGIVSARAPLLEGMSMLQNLALPFSLDIDPLADAARERAMIAGREVGLGEADWDVRISSAPPLARVRLRLARALALDPAIVVLEHPTAEVERNDAAPLGREIRAILDRRGAAGLALTADEEFARAFAARSVHLQAASGRLVESRRGWFARMR